MINKEIIKEILTILDNKPLGLVFSDIFENTKLIDEEKKLAIALNHCRKENLIEFIHNSHRLIKYKNCHVPINTKKTRCAELNRETIPGKIAEYLCKNPNTAYALDDIYANLGLGVPKSYTPITQLARANIIVRERIDKRTYIAWSKEFDYPFKLEEYIEERLNKIFS